MKLVSNISLGSKVGLFKRRGFHLWHPGNRKSSCSIPVIRNQEGSRIMTVNGCKQHKIMTINIGGSNEYPQSMF